jgi:hypothetical protein
MSKIVDFVFDEDMHKLIRETFRNGKTHAKPIEVEKLPKIIEYRDNKVKISSIYGEMKDNGEKD